MLRPTRKRDAAKPNHPTRQRIVEETARRIMEGGIEGVDVDAVLATVGVTKGALYHHFGSVNDLFIAGLLNAFEAVIRESEAWSLALRDECKSAKEVRDRLHLIIEESQVPERSEMRSVRLHTLSLARTQPELASEIARLQSNLTETITEVNKEFQRRGWMRTDVDPRAAAVLIQAMNLGRIVDDVVDEAHRVDAEAWIALYKEIHCRYLIIEE